MLDVCGLSVFYGKHRALDNVAVNVARGEIVVILGSNGAGKTTLLKAIGGLVPAPGARIAVDSRDLSGRIAHEIVEAGIALVPEGRGIFGDLSVRENLLLGAYPKRARAGERGNLDRVLSLFPRLQERLMQTVRTMSGGEQQMVAIGRAMMSAPDVLLLDEPSLGLSPIMCKELFVNLARIREAGPGMLLVEQNTRQSLAIADRGYVLSTGRITAAGTAAALKNDTALAHAYFGGAEPS